MAAIEELNKGQQEKLQRLLNACVRYVTNVPRMHFVTLFRLNLGWLSSSNHRVLIALCFIYNQLTTQKPELLNGKISIYIPPRRIRNPPQKMTIPRSHSADYDNSLYIHYARIWNNLLSEIRLANLYENLLSNERLPTPR